jgi:beta-1,4-mannosyl-glycoprotein beta-1,4-N-acetylglucosaminyltransferase
MTYDCFSFFNELDLLEIRLHTLDKVVDKFILAEAPYTHTGNPKPLYYSENKERFAEFNDRIIHIVVDDFPDMPKDMTTREKAWIRENWQRNAIIRGLPQNIKNDDILLISDLDEIPSPEHVQVAIENPIGVTRLDMKAYCFFINLRNVSYPIWNSGTKILTWATFNDSKTYSKTQYSECCIGAVNQGPSATRVRFLKPNLILKDAGWHFSYLGGVKAIQRKMKSIAHTEFDTEAKTSLENIRSRLKHGKGFVNSAELFLPEVIDKRFPIEIAQNLQKYKNLLTTVVPQKNPSITVCLLIRTRAILRDLMFKLIAKSTPKFLLKLRHKLYCRLSNTK